MPHPNVVLFDVRVGSTGHDARKGPLRPRSCQAWLFDRDEMVIQRREQAKVPIPKPEPPAERP